MWLFILINTWNYMGIGQGLLLKRISYWICRGFYGNPHAQRTLSIQENLNAFSIQQMTRRRTTIPLSITRLIEHSMVTLML